MAGNSNFQAWSRLKNVGLSDVRLCGFILVGNYVNGKDSVGVKELNKESVLMYELDMRANSLLEITTRRHHPSMYI